MKILNYIACFLLPLAIINSNNTMAIKQEKVGINQNYNNSVDGVMKFYNYSGGNMCSLASLNQCLSALNPGNNEILKAFKQIYDSVANYKDNKNTKFSPQRVLSNVLDYLPNNNEYKRVLLYNDGVDIDERYMNLISISEMFGADISKINNYTSIYPDEEACETLGDEIIRRNEDLRIHGQDAVNYNDVMNLVLQFDNMSLFNKYKNEIRKANDILIDNNSFSLSSVAFRTISRSDAKLNNNISQSDQRAYYANKSYTHFISAKKLANGKWALIDSLSPNNIRTYNSFELLMDNLGDRYLPRMVFFSKTQNNNVNNNNRLRSNNKNRNRRVKINKDNINKTDNNTVVNNKKRENININEYNTSRNKKHTNININEYNTNNIKKNPININTYNINKNKSKISINVNEYDINSFPKNKVADKKNNNKNITIEARINELKSHIINEKAAKDDSINLLKACLKEGGYNINDSLDVINELYHNHEIRNLIMKNNESDDIYNYLSNFEYGYLTNNNYMTLISDIFNKHAKLKDLKAELSEIEKM